MLGKLKDLGELTRVMRQAEDFKKALQDLQHELQEMRIVVDSDEDIVRVTIDGKGRILDLGIDSDRAGHLDHDDLEAVILSTIEKAQNRSVYVAEERRDRVYDHFKIDKKLITGL